MTEKEKLKVEEEDNESDDKDSKKKNKKKKVKEEEEEEDTEESHKKSSKKVSKIESAVQSSDVEKGGEDNEILDPMKDKNRLKILKKCISHLCLLILVLAVQNVFLGLCAQAFYDNKTHLVLFGGLAIMQLIGGPIGWVAIKQGNRFLFLVCAIINTVWIISVTILLSYYWFINKSQTFNQEISLHVGAVFFLSASITLCICCFFMMKRLDMINIQYKKPEVVISAEGKASEKAKLKKKSKN